MPDGSKSPASTFGRLARRSAIPALVAVVAWLGLSLLLDSDTGRRFELRAWDLRCRVWCDVPQSPRITHVDIDDPSFRQIGSWPLPRLEYVKVLEVLEDYDPEVVLFDITFRNRGSVGPDQVLETVGHLGTQARTLAEALPTDTSDPEALRRWSELAREFFDELKQRIDRIDNPDLVFARRVEQSGNVILPFNFNRRDIRTHRWFDRAVDIIEHQPTIEGPHLVDRLGDLSPEEARLVRQHTEHLRREAGVELLLRHESAGGPIPPELAPLLEEARKLVERRRAVVRRAAIDTTASSPVPPGAIESIDPPILPLARAVDRTGYVSTAPDELDGVFRRVPLARRQDGRLFLHAGFLAVLNLLKVAPGSVDFSQPGRIVVTSPEQTIDIPVDEHFNMLVNWPHTDWPDTFNGVPFGLIRELWHLRRGRLAELARLDLHYSRPATIPDLVTRLDATPDDAALQQQLEDHAHRLISRLQGLATRGRGQLDRGGASETMRSQVEQLERELAGLERMQRRIDKIDTRLKQIIPGRIVVIGQTMTSGTDLKPTPLQSQYPGVGVVASTMNTVLTERFRREAPRWVDRLILLVLVGATVALGMALGPRRAALSAVLLVAGYLVVSQVFFRHGLVLAAVGPVSGVVIVFAATAAYRELTEQRARRHVRRAFEHYVAPAVVEQLMDNPQLLMAGGRRRELSVFFADIIGFTAISETVDAQVLDRLVRRAHTEVTEEVLSHGGTHDKFVGDMEMAFFGAPIEQPDHALRACRAAVATTDRLRRWSDQLEAEGLPRIAMRIGINTGPMIVGNMGSEQQWDFTVLGDAVNTGSRIQDNARLFGIHMMVGESTAAAVRDEMVLRDLGRIMVKNKRLPIRVYELICPTDRGDDALRDRLARFAQGLVAYRDRRWDEAVDIFWSLDDGPSRAYAASAELLKETPPEDAWTGWFIEPWKREPKA